MSVIPTIDASHHKHGASGPMPRQLSDTALDIETLRRLYSDGGVVPAPALIGEIYRRIRSAPDLGASSTTAYCLLEAP